MIRDTFVVFGIGLVSTFFYQVGRQGTVAVRQYYRNRKTA